MAARLPGDHPSKAIVASVNDYLAGRCIVLGVTASVSAYKSVDVARWLMRRGAKVIPVLTRPASELVTPMLFHWATGEKAVVDYTGEVEHILYSKDCDSMIVAPATLSTMAKIANGIVDNNVALTAISMLGEGKPVMVVPAMHQSMMNSPVYKTIVEKLEEQGVVILPPKVEEGVAKYPDVWTVARAAAALTARGRDLEGKQVLVTAGATREWIDPARFISNPSSGRMGIEVAVEAWARGADVYLVHGSTSHVLPHMVRRYEVDTTEDMAEAVDKILGQVEIDIAVAAAAPADYKPVKAMEKKMKSGITGLTLELEPTPKVIGVISGRTKTLVAFAAETVESSAELELAALEKLEKYNADIVVANVIGRKDVGFSSKDLEALLMWRSNGEIQKEYVGRIDKEILARIILDTALQLEGEK
ncbi:MAG: bifunctional phosphopantothenoylcysteine decarboxylase/phosphopantothenate--cysteine ligase CoaBC [Desulfurococcales archaeon]|nr:bifunctional phosphopantothenoylcysteine decarboxylase/phosphopantothenate--cysteine ligase CoaBC [Desulfurococcales archaeon]